MSEIAQYVLGVVVIPALIAAVVALPFVMKPLRGRHRFVEAGLACALMTAFVVSFANELGSNALLRQVMTIPNDDAPFEKWHRVGMTAAVLGLAACFIPWLQGATTNARLARGVGLALASAVLVGVFVRFPAQWSGWQFVQGLLVASAILGFALMGRGTILWSAWITFGLLGFFAGDSGFASLAVMCGATSMAAFLVATLWSLGGLRQSREERERVKDAAARFERPEELPSTGAIAIALGTLLAVVAWCGHAYDSAKVWEFQWMLAAMLPIVGLTIAQRLFRWFNLQRGYAPLLVACVALAAFGMVGYLKWTQSSRAKASPSGDQELRDMYGG